MTSPGAPSRTMAEDVAWHLDGSSDWQELQERLERLEEHIYIDEAPTYFLSEREGLFETWHEVDEAWAWYFPDGSAVVSWKAYFDITDSRLVHFGTQHYRDFRDAEAVANLMDEHEILEEFAHPLHFARTAEELLPLLDHGSERIRTLAFTRLGQLSQDS